MNYEKLMPLHLAAQNGSEQVAALLIEHGASIDAKGEGCSPLLIAAIYGKIHEFIIICESNGIIHNL